MKKKTSGILLLSTFAAMVLAGCGTKPATSTDGGSSVAPGTSVDGGTSNAGTSNTATTSVGGTSTTSAGGTSTTSVGGTSTPASSTTSAGPAASSSSQAASSSSTPKTWAELGLCGEYKGGMASLIINNDNTTSWGTSTAKHPATMTALANGVYHIQSAASVAAEDKVDIYTDGTMAHVIQDEEAADNYVMDKNATGAAANAFAETEDEETYFGAVETSNGHWKYFQYANGAYTFGVNITLQAGVSINGLGGIFSVGTGANAKSYRVTTPAAGEGGFAEIELFNLTVTTYHGDHGDLVIGKTEGGELAFAKLEGNELFGATLEGNTLVVKGTEYEIDVNAQGGPAKVYQSTVYTLESIAGRYTAAAGTVNEALLHALTGDTGTYGVEVDGSGMLWATFTAPAAGKLTVEETVAILNPTSTTGAVADTCMWFLDVGAAPYTTTSMSAGSGLLGYNDNGTTGHPHIDDFAMAAGQTVVIKIGYWNEYGKGVGSTGSTYAGQYEEIGWTFTAFTKETYTSAEGDTLELNKDGTTLISVTLNNVPYAKPELTGNTLVLKDSAPDPEDPTGATTIITTTTITLDAANNSFTKTVTSESNSLFHGLTATNPTYTANAGADGSVWAIFTAPADGILDISTSDSPVDDIVNVFVFNPATSDPADLKGTSTGGANGCIKYQDTPDAANFSIQVTAGTSYVIKATSWANREVGYGGVAASGAQGVEHTISIAFSALTNYVYTCAGQADVTLSFKDDGTLYSAKLGTTAMAGYSLNADGTELTIKGTATIVDGANPTRTSTDTIYTFDKVANTYVKTTPTTTEDIMQTLTATSTRLAGPTGNDANIWGKFTATADGFITLKEKTSCYPTGDTAITIYEQDSTPTYSDYTYASSTSPNMKATNKATFNTADEPAHINNFPVEAGKTYVIKAGYGQSYNYNENNYTAAAKGTMEVVSFSYSGPVVTTYTGAEGALVVTTLDDAFYKAVLGDDEATAVTYMTGEISLDGSTITVEKDWIDNSTPSDPKKVHTTKTFTVDGVNGTYEVETTDVPTSLFAELSAANPTITGVTGEDGAMWAMFRAPEDGTLTVSSSDMAGDDMLSIFLFDGTQDPATFKGTSGGSLIGYADTPEPCSKTISVEKGKTYVFKHNLWATRDVGYGGKATSGVGLPSTITIQYSGYTSDDYTDGDGNVLAVKSLGGVYQKTTLNDETLSGYTRSADGLTYTGSTTKTLNDEGDPVVSWTDVTYTLNSDEHSFTKATEEHHVDIIQGVLDGTTNTIDATTLDNGSAVVKFVAPADGTYTITSVTPTTNDSKLGVYSDRTCKTVLPGKPAVDDGKETETITFTATAGQVVYVKVAYYGCFSRDLTDMSAATNSTYAKYCGNAVTFTLS